MLNGILGGGGLLSSPLIIKNSWQKLGKCNQYEFLQVYWKYFGKFLKQFSKLLSALGACHVTIIGGAVYTKSMIEDFENISAIFLYFSMKSLFIARSYPVLVMNIKSLIICVLGTLKRRLNVPILAVLWRFWASLNRLFWHKPLA